METEAAARCKTSSYQAPSFSWASRRGAVDYEFALGRADLVTPFETIKLLEYGTHQIGPRFESGDCFGALDDAELLIEANLLPVSTCYRLNNFEDDTTMSILLSIPAATFSTVGFLDDPVGSQKLQGLFVLPLAMTCKYYEWHLTFLILRIVPHVADVPAFERVGMGHYGVSLETNSTQASERARRFDPLILDRARGGRRRIEYLLRAKRSVLLLI